MSNEPTFDPRRKAAIRDLVVANAAAHPGRSGGRKRTALIVTLVLLAVSISGGTVAYALGTGLLDPTPIVAAPATETPTPTPTPTVTPTPTPAPTAAPPVQDPSDPSTWVIRFDGIGPVTLGSTLDSVHTAIPSWTDVTYDVCVEGQRDLTAPDGLGLVASSANGGAGGVGEVAVWYNFTVSGVKDLATPRTAEGIGVGSTFDQLMTAYPGITKTGEYNESATYYGLSDGSGAWIAFGVIDGRVEQIQVGPHSTLPSELCPA